MWLEQRCFSHISHMECFSLNFQLNCGLQSIPLTAFNGGKLFHWCSSHPKTSCLPRTWMNFAVAPKDRLRLEVAKFCLIDGGWRLGMPCTQCTRSAHAVRTQCEVLDVGQYFDPSFGPFSQASVEAVRFALQSTLPDR